VSETRRIQYNLNIADEQATARLASRLARTLRPGEVLALRGGLGAGKTTLVRHLAAALGIDPDTVSSPTFVLINEYPVPSPTSAPGTSPGISRLIHIDAYRLSGDEELDTIGWHEAIAAGDAILAIEWPSRIEPALEALGDSVLWLELEATGEHSRRGVLRLPPGRDLAPLSGQGDQPGQPGQPAGESRPPEPTSCRTCGKPVLPGRSFCSDTCQMAELHKWLTGQYIISRELQEKDEVEGNGER
jgi:tRNA threonylcarbamoyladenosine biosynthesis protein TsaE